MTRTKATPVSNVLLLIVGLLAGFVGGYTVARQGAPVSPEISTLGQQQSKCPHDLEPEDRPILAGFKCPSGCASPLVDCHCNFSHQLKDQIKQMLREGKSHEETKEEVREQYKLKI